jgi:hypothetical protein
MLTTYLATAAASTWIPVPFAVLALDQGRDWTYWNDPVRCRSCIRLATGPVYDFRLIPGRGLALRLSPTAAFNLQAHD